MSKTLPAYADRLYDGCEWQDHRFAHRYRRHQAKRTTLLRHARAGALPSILRSHPVCDGHPQRRTAQDQDIAAMLMRSGKPVFLVVNKVDGVGEPPMELYDFYSLGIGEPYPVSSARPRHGRPAGSGVRLPAWE
ncbi:MAG: hypothetical protein ACLRZH_11585 [Ruthenibacterium lactatiformans]